MKKIRSGSFEFGMPLILTTAGIVTFIICVIVFFNRGEQPTVSPEMESRLTRLEQSMGDLKRKVDQLAAEMTRVASATPPPAADMELLSALPEQIEAIKKQLSFIDQRQGNLEQKMAGAQSAPSPASGRPPAKRTVKRTITEKPKHIPAPKQYHQVAAGETLFSIAQKYDVSVESLRQWNNLPSNQIDIGQRLIVGN